MRILPYALAALIISVSTPVLAETGAQALANTRPLVSLGMGHFDMLDSDKRDEATSLRFEYRFGTPFFYVVKPQLSLELTTDGSAGAFVGLVADWLVARHWVIAPSLSAGLWADGSGKEMGSTVQFRSQLETGYRFDNDWRLVAAFSHMSNGDLGHKNPGVETGLVYLQMPAETLLPR